MSVLNFFGKKASQETDPNATSTGVQAARAGSEDKPSASPLREAVMPTRRSWAERIGRALRGKKEVSEEVLDRLEEALVEGDVAVDTTLEIIRRLERRVKRDKYVNAAELRGIMREEITAMMTPSAEASGMKEGGAAPVSQGGGMKEGGETPVTQRGGMKVVMVVGVNGVGKTTTVGKMASRLTSVGGKVVIGAADTFRAAAMEQAEVWAQRAGATFVGGPQGSDPSSVAFEAVKRGLREGADAVIVDTAGRLHNRQGLMDELAKMRRVMGKAMEGAPHEVLLVVDASTGQNALTQAKEFGKATPLTGICVTKLDGSAKGGVVVSVAWETGVPVRLIGVGEGVDDLRPFDADEFVDALVGDEVV